MLRPPLALLRLREDEEDDDGEPKLLLLLALRRPLGAAEACCGVLPPLAAGATAPGSVGAPRPSPSSSRVLLLRRSWRPLLPLLPLPLPLPPPPLADG